MYVKEYAKRNFFCQGRLVCLPVRIELYLRQYKGVNND